jgi:hypothetical protein
MHDYFNDVLLLPIFLPVSLLINRWLGLRRDDRSPSLIEVGGYFLLWSALFQLVFPRHAWLFRHSTDDPYNVVAFGIGGLVAWLTWNRRSILTVLRDRRFNRTDIAGSPS